MSRFRMGLVTAQQRSNQRMMPLHLPPQIPVQCWDETNFAKRSEGHKKVTRSTRSKTTLQVNSSCFSSTIVKTLPSDGLKLPSGGLYLPSDGLKLPSDGLQLPSDVLHNYHLMGYTYHPMGYNCHLMVNYYLMVYNYHLIN